MTQSVKHFHCEHKNMDLDAQNPYEMPDGVIHACTPRDRTVRDSGALEARGYFTILPRPERPWKFIQR